MPELTLAHVAMLAGTLLLGVMVGWTFRSSRSTREKKSINAGWQSQIDSQQSEHDRLAEQNMSLMQQISQYQASNKDSKMRAKELSDSLKEAFERRDELQRQLKDIRSNLEIAVAERDKLQSSASQGQSSTDAIAERDKRIQKLSKELANWQQRVPPLVERYRVRDLEAQQLEVELRKANDHINTLESMSRGEHTRIEPVDSSSLPEGLDASNEPHTATSILDPAEFDDDLEDQVEAVDEEAESVDANSPMVPDDWLIPDDSESEEPLDDGVEIADPVETAQLDSLLDEEVMLEADEDNEEERVGDEDFIEDPVDVSRIDAMLDEEVLLEADEENEGERSSDEDSVEDAVDVSRIDALLDEEVLLEADADGEEERVEDEQSEVVPGNGFPNLLDEGYVTGMHGPDDLQQIKGVGPAIEKTLNDLGIYRYNQIAEMSEYDIDRVAQELKGFRSRIYREDWIGQARLLQQQKNID